MTRLETTDQIIESIQVILMDDEIDPSRRLAMVSDLGLIKNNGYADGVIEVAIILWKHLEMAERLKFLNLQTVQIREMNWGGLIRITEV